MGYYEREKMMRKILTAAFIGLMLLCWNAVPATAEFFAEALIYNGPPDYGYPYLEGSSPVSVNSLAAGKDSQSQTDWWSLGGGLNVTWDDSFQGWRYVFSHITKEFQVTQAGAATIQFGFQGSMQVAGSTAQNGDYYLYSGAEIYDDTLEENAAIYWYDDLSNPGQITFNEVGSFEYLFDESDIGTVFEIDLTFYTAIEPGIGVTLSFAEGESLDFISTMHDSLKIVSISDNIQAVDGPELPQAVPVPASFWILGTGIALLAFRKKA